MAEEKGDTSATIEERALQAPDRTVLGGGQLLPDVQLTPLAEKAPMALEDMAVQQPPRNAIFSNAEKAPKDRTSDKITERDTPEHRMSTVPGAAGD